MTTIKMNIIDSCPSYAREEAYEIKSHLEDIGFKQTKWKREDHLNMVTLEMIREE